MVTSKPRREDESDDANFYRQPRLVQHIDDSFIESLQAEFRRYLKDSDVILDLMSSWVSHLPNELEPRRVVGHGMNRTELAANPRLSEFFVQNLNQDPRLPFGDNTFNAVLNTVSIQYLVDAVAVLQEVNRVLVPGGVVLISFSNRMFPTKAVSTWREGSDAGHIALVRGYLESSGFTGIEVHRRKLSGFSQWLTLSQDPFYCLSAYKPALEQGLADLAGDGR